MSTINQVRGFEVLDSRGNPTVAAEERFTDGGHGFAAAPSGASIGALLMIEHELGNAVSYPGRAALRIQG
jgi:enolase